MNPIRSKHQGTTADAVMDGTKAKRKCGHSSLWTDSSLATSDVFLISKIVEVRAQLNHRTCKSLTRECQPEAVLKTFGLSSTDLRVVSNKEVPKFDTPLVQVKMRMF